MGIWYFWEQYLKALDNFSVCEVQRGVTEREPSLLDRETSAVSRFFLAVKRMPKAWGSRPWTSQEMTRAGNAVSNDLFRRKMRRDLDLSLAADVRRVRVHKQV
jgi:hypothetical protein